MKTTITNVWLALFIWHPHSMNFEPRFRKNDVLFLENLNSGMSSFIFKLKRPGGSLLRELFGKKLRFTNEVITVCVLFFLFVCLFVCLLVRLFVCLQACVFACLPACLFACFLVVFYVTTWSHADICPWAIYSFCHFFIFIFCNLCSTLCLMPK